MARRAKQLPVPWDDEHDVVGSPATSDPISFIVYGQPQPKGSARGFAVQVKDASGRPVLDQHGHPKYRAIVTSDNPSAKDWERSARVAAQTVAGGRFFDGPVSVVIEIGVLRPASVSATRRPFPTVRPDLDKIMRNVFDAMNKVLFRDDAQVVSVAATKVYCDGPAYARVTVSAYDGPRRLEGWHA